MKNNIALYAMLAVGPFLLGSCGGPKEESCEKDQIPICKEAELTVTVCCTSETECKYDVDGTAYNTIEEAIDDNNSQCTPDKASGARKSRLLERVKTLAARARAKL